MRLYGTVKLVFNSNLKVAPKEPTLGKRVNCMIIYPGTIGIIFLGLTIVALGGYAYDGVFQDALIMETEDARAINAKIKDGVIHGLVHMLGMRHLFPLASELDPKLLEITAYTRIGLGMAVNYKNGRPEGNVWMGLSGGSQLYGTLNEEGKFTGDKI